MGLSAAAYARQLKALLPQGPAWNLEASSAISKLLLGIADELARLDGRGVTLIDESDPRTVFETIPDWERVLDLPDPCAAADLSIAQRRAAIVATMTAVGGQTPAYFISVAEALGFTVTIQEFTPHNVADDCETPLVGEAWAYAWQVNGLTLTGATEFTADSYVDEFLSWWVSSALECVLERLKPAHTYLLFSYS